MNRKIKKAILVIAFTASTIILLLILYKVRIVKKCEITNRIDFGGEQFNYMQNGMPFSVYADENSIYFFSKDKECFGHALYKIEEHKATKLLDFKQQTKSTYYYSETPCFFINNKLIYCVNCSDENGCSIISFDLKTREKMTISEGLDDNILRIIINSFLDTRVVTPRISGDTRSIIFPISGYDFKTNAYVEYGFCSISDNKISLLDNKNDTYISLGDYNYYLSDGFLVQIDRYGNNTELISLGEVNQPLLLTDHNLLLIMQVGTTGILKIDTNGIITELFNPYGGDKVYSSIQVYDNYLYLSVRRYKKSGLLETVRFKNDEIEGLWRVNISTGVKNKISKKMYEQLYIFDDSGIIACSFSKDIVKLDFDGNVIDYIVRGTFFEHLHEFWRNHLSKAE